MHTATLAFTEQTPGLRADIARDDFADIAGLIALYKEAGEIFIYNAGDKDKGFALCLKCGFAESETQEGQGAMGLPRNFGKHAPLISISRRRACWAVDESSVLRNQTLSAREVTDALMLDFGAVLGKTGDQEALVTTLAYALHRAGADLLELDSRELGVLLTPSNLAHQGYGAAIYDNTPGGSGHVRELLDAGRRWLERAQGILRGTDEHDLRCESACLDCLLAFDTQQPVSQRLLKRRASLAVLDALLAGRAVPSASAPPIDQGVLPIAPVSSSMLTSHDRLERSARKLARRQSHP